MDKYPLHRTGATGYNGTGERTRYERSTVYPLPRSKGKEGEGEVIVYNIEDFVIKQMFMPYKTLLISEDNLPENELDRIVEYKKREKTCINELRKNPERIIEVLNNNKKAYQCVFMRLSRLDFKFYKWLKHPLIDYVNAGVCAYRTPQNDEARE